MLRFATLRIAANGSSQKLQTFTQLQLSDPSSLYAILF